MARSRAPLNPKSRHPAIISMVPFDVWNYISLFLPDSQLWKLYSVNRAFFYISMSLRYNSVSLSGPAGFSGNARGKYAKILNDPSLGKYVGVLTFNLSEFAPSQGVGRLLPRNKPPQSNSALAVASVTTYFYALSHPAQKKKALEFETKAQKTRAFIASLEQLTSLVLQYRCCPKILSYKIPTDMFLLGWQTFGARLRNLSLHMTIESFLNVFSADLYFPQLKELVLDIDKCPPPNTRSRRSRRKSRESRNLTQSQPSPTPFINLVRRHLETLASLRIISLFSLDREDVYTGIGALPNLQKFSLEEASNYQELSPPTMFLLLNYATLTEFSWSLDRGPSWTKVSMPPTPAQTPFNVTLPALRKLSIGLSWTRHSIAHIRKVADYIGRHSQTLTHLSFSGEWRYDDEELYTFLRAIQTSQLRVLDIPLGGIRVPTFPGFAYYLPHIETLRISFGGIGSDVRIKDDDSSDSDRSFVRPAKIGLSDEFIEKMKTPYLRDWHIHNLFFHKRPFNYDLKMEFLVAQVIVKSIPHLRFIGGMGRQEFLRAGPSQVNGIFRGIL